MKKMTLLIPILAFVLIACSGSDASYAPESYPASDTASYGGGDFAVEYEAEEAFARDETITQSAVPQEQERVVLKNATIGIAVTDPGNSMDEIMTMAEAMGGFVVSSNLYYRTLSSGAEVPQAYVQVRVPAERLTEALTEIESGAGRVLSKNVTGEDVTRQYTDLQSRLRNLEQTEAQLAEIMDAAEDTEDVLNVFNQLTNIREQIEVIQGQIQYYQQSAAFSSVSVEIMADEAVQPLTIGGWQPAGVARDAIQALINTLTGLGDFAIYLVLYLLPVLFVIGLPIYLFVRWIRALWRRRKGTSPKTDKQA